VIGGRFEPIGAGGEGGTADVIRARDATTGREVALKIMRVQSDARFEREVSILESLHHPRVVGYVAHGTTDDGRLFLALDWVEGETLESRLATRGVSAEAAVRIVSSAARTLGDLHAMGLVHRDLKPANLMLRGGSEDDVVVMDFGIARSAESALITSTNMFVGTPAYIAPEQAQGARDVDARADVYSLGCVLFECLTGKRPFEGSDILSVLAKVVAQPAPSLDTAPRDYPPELVDLLARTMSKSRQHRPTDGSTLAAELDALPPVGTKITLSSSNKMRFEGDDVRTVLVASTEGEPRTVRFEGSATEQAIGAARAALGMGGARVAIATGRSEEQATARAVAMLTKTMEGIRLDPHTVALLGARFDISLAEGGGYLRGERTATVRPFVGRETELAMLAGAYAACVDDEAIRVISIVSPAGSGKTRLIDEAIARMQPPRVYKTSATKRRQLARALDDELTSPTVLVIDDVQMIDDTSVTLVEQALDRARDRAVLVVILANAPIDERCEALFRGRSVTSLQLEPI
jgi:eukaryotic-like serine/threonine-protein kinase